MAWAAPRQLGVGEVDADDETARADCACGTEGVSAGSGAEVEHPVAGLQPGEVEVVPDARERCERRAGDRVEQRLRVAEPQREAAARLEVAWRDGIARDAAVDLLDLPLELGAIDERRRVGLRQVGGSGIRVVVHAGLLD